VERHVEHGLALLGCLGALRGGRWLDLGSGGGAPGLILALAVPEARLVLLDAGERRCRFLREAVSELGIGDRVEVVQERAESAARAPALREALDVVVARSFGGSAVTAECAVGFLRSGGRLVVSEPPGGGGTADRWPAEGLDQLGLGPAEPCGTAEASFVRMEKRRAEERWPRRVGVPAKRPLW
jgi:16S rRNA (guanine527-N7)-methyltransferase